MNPSEGRVAQCSGPVRNDGGGDDHFRALVEGASDWIWEVDASGRYIYASPQIRALLGYEPAELIGRTPFDLMPPDEAARVAHVFASHVEACRPFTGLVNINLHKDGRRVVLETSGVPVLDEHGQLLGFRGIDRDITARRVAEEEVRYRLAFEQVITGLSTRFVSIDPLTIDGEIDNAIAVLGAFADVDRCYVFLFRLDGRLMDNTHEWCSMGIEPQRERLQALSVSEYRLVAEHVARGEVVHVPNVGRLPDGPERREFEFERIQSVLMVPVVCAGEITGFLGMDAVRTSREWPDDLIALLRIVGEILGSALMRRRVELALRRENALREAIIARLGEGLCVARVLARPPFVEFTVWNVRMAEITGLARERVNHGRWPLLLGDRGQRRRALERLRRALSGDDLEAEEWLLARADGQKRRVSVSTTLLPEVDGEPHLLALVQDVTERRALEERLTQVQKLEAIGTLAGGIAHDFNNLLAVIIGHTDLLRARLGAGSEAARDLGQVRGAANSAAELTRQLLAFGRKQVLAQHVLDLNSVVSDLDRMLRRVIGEDVALRVELTPDLGRVRADPNQLGQVLMNLVVNARDAMPDGGELTITTSNSSAEALAWLEPTENAARAFVMISVADTGVGMDAATKLRIFEPFFTTKELGRGTGLGLSSAYGIVKQSGGYITCDSEPGRGSVFRVYLPRVEGALRAQEPVEGRAPRASGAETVLVSEDDPDVGELVSKILRDAGYAVLLASGGEAALAVADAHPGELALLLTDVVMPRMSGPELARRMRVSRPALKVLYMSGYTRGVVGRSSDAPFIEKPFAPAALLARVREAIDG